MVKLYRIDCFLPADCSEMRLCCYCCCCAGEPALRKDLTRQEAVQQRQAADQLQRQLKSILADSGTTLESDQNLLSEGHHLTARHAQAVRARLEQKQLLVVAQQVLQTYTDSMMQGVSLAQRVLQSR